MVRRAMDPHDRLFCLMSGLEEQTMVKTLVDV